MRLQSSLRRQNSGPIHGEHPGYIADTGTPAPPRSPTSPRPRPTRRTTNRSANRQLPNADKRQHFPRQLPRQLPRSAGMCSLSKIQGSGLQASNRPVRGVVARPAKHGVTAQLAGRHLALVENQVTMSVCACQNHNHSISTLPLLTPSPSHNLHQEAVTSSLAVLLQARWLTNTPGCGKYEVDPHQSS